MLSNLAIRLGYYVCDSPCFFPCTLSFDFDNYNLHHEYGSNYFSIMEIPCLTVGL